MRRGRMSFFCKSTDFEVAISRAEADEALRRTDGASLGEEERKHFVGAAESKGANFGTI